MTHKLLLADGNLTIQRVVELTFSGEDVEVVAVSDGEQAITRIPIERPDIVLADIGMLKRSGYEVSAFVKGDPDLAHIPVLLLAGAFEPVDEVRAAEVKCDGVLVKPFEPLQVIARVRELVDGAKGSPTWTAAGVPRPVERLLHTGARPSAPRVPGPEPLVASPRPPSPESQVPSPESRAPSPEKDTSLDDYFDRLDAALATRSNAQSKTPGADTAATRDSDPSSARADVPTVDDILGGALALTPPAGPGTPFGHVAPPPVEPPDMTATLTAAARPIVTAPDARDPEPPGQRVKIIAEAFTALFAVEQGEPGATPVRFGLPAPPPHVTDELVDKVTRRVLERLAPDAARDLVADIVSEVAERLVREEIARIRGR